MGWISLKGQHAAALAVAMVGGCGSVADRTEGEASVGTQVQALPSGRRSPVLECVFARADGSFQAIFGYNNTAAEAVDVPAGANNSFHPEPGFRGQPTSFLPGRQQRVFGVVFAASEKLVWRLGSSTATAAANSKRCSSPLVASDFDDDGIKDAADNCPAVANAGQADGDSDKLGDACDTCDGGADADRDGVCDAVDNCSASPNPAQRDVNGNGQGDACDDQRCYMPLEGFERQRAIELTLAHSASLSLRTHDYRVIQVVPACKSYGSEAPRMAKVSVFDYTDQKAWMAVVNLSSGLVESVEPTLAHLSSSAEEDRQAIALADQHPTVQATPNLDYSLTSAEAVSSSGRRTLHVVYASRSATEWSATPPEAYASQVFWRGGLNRLIVTVDLGLQQVVSVEPAN